MSTSSNGKAEDAGCRSLLIERRLDELWPRLERAERLDVTLQHRLLKLLGETLRCGALPPSEARRWRASMSREDLNWVIESLTSRLEAMQLDRPSCGSRGLARVRDALESVRVAVRWVCLAHDFEPLDLPAWRPLSELARRFDAVISEAVDRGEAITVGLTLIDDADPANWLVRLGAALPAAPARCGATTDDRLVHGEAPAWSVVKQYLRSGRHQALVEGHAASQASFADVLEWLVNTQRRTCSRVAQRWTDARREARGASRGPTPGRVSVPVHHAQKPPARPRRDALVVQLEDHVRRKSRVAQWVIPPHGAGGGQSVAISDGREEPVSDVGPLEENPGSRDFRKDGGTVADADRRVGRERG